jgi:polysaccharide biosynthesis protein PelA
MGWRHVVAVAVVLFAGVAAADDPSRRVVLSLYDGKADPDVRFTAVHRVAEMPLNHLGLIVRHHDYWTPLPGEAELGDVRGAVVWFTGGSMPAPLAFIEWANGFLDGGRKLVIIGHFGIAADPNGKPTPTEAINGLLGRLGLRFDDRYVEFTQDVRIVRRDREIFDFEAELPSPLPGYPRIVKADAATNAHLIVREGGDTSSDATLVSTHPNGGMVVGELFHRGFYRTPIKQLYLNPFEYLRRTFDVGRWPVPDTTTLVGRRIYYSHIDGDGWRNITQVRRYAQRRALSAEVILREAIEPFPDLPVTVAPIVADLDSDWFGSEQTIAVARELFSLPQVEIGSHTLSHPLEWAFFADGDATKEVPILGRYPRRPGGHDEQAWAPVIRRASARRDLGDATYSGVVGNALGRYVAPRVYATRPFDLGAEIRGSIDFLRTLAPAGKDVALLQWSGDCAPWAEAIAETYRAGVVNINGGDTRFDREHPTYSSVAPIGRVVSGAIQIYASNTNENLYTGLWTERFFGFTFLTQTWRNTEVPVRIKPKNVYYHMYSGERQASLRALLSNLKAAESEPIAPIAASDYARIALGFYSTRITDLGDRRWRITDRGRLSTLRLDRASDVGVDFARSTGVIGQQHFQGSLYIALDPAVAEAIVAVAPLARTDVPPPADRAYLIESRWQVERLDRSGDRFSFRAWGFGAGAMTWKVPASGRYEVVADDGERQVTSFAETDQDGRIELTIGTRRLAPAEVTVRLIGGRG